MSSEHTFVEAFIRCLSCFAYEKGRESLEKEKDACKAAPNIPQLWPLILNAFTQLHAAEKSYTSLLFLNQKWFGRKDNKSAYTVLSAEFKRIEELGMKHGESLTSLAHVCGQLMEYANARSKMMDFFEQLHALGTSRFTGKEDLQIVLSEVVGASCKKFHHPLLAPLKASFAIECDIVKHLLQADEEMARWQFLGSLLHLNHAHGKLTSIWAAVSPPQKDSWKLSFAGIKHASAPPPLYEWLKKYRDALLAKFGLYFYEILSKQVQAGELMKTLSKTSNDYYSKIVSFHKKSECTLVALMLDTNGIEYRGAGYRCPLRPAETLAGTSSFPVVFSYPHLQDLPSKELSNRHVAAIVMLMGRRERELNLGDKVFYEYDSNVQSTYFLSRIDQHVTMVVIHESKKSDKECKNIGVFIQDITTQLRCTRLYSGLRPG